MKPYKNLSGASGVSEYEIGQDSITVRFIDGQGRTSRYYLYTFATAGKQNIEEMKALAKKGKGLSTFISTKIKMKYEKKW